MVAGLQFLFGGESLAVQEGAVAAAQIADSRQAFARADYAVVAADPPALRPQLAPFRPADQKLRPGNRDGLPGVFPADGNEFDFHSRTGKLPEVVPL